MDQEDGMAGLSPKKVLKEVQSPACGSGIGPAYVSLIFKGPDRAAQEIALTGNPSTPRRAFEQQSRLLEAGAYESVQVRRSIKFSLVDFKEDRPVLLGLGPGSRPDLPILQI